MVRQRLGWFAVIALGASLLFYAYVNQLSNPPASLWHDSIEDDAALLSSGDQDILQTLQQYIDFMQQQFDIDLRIKTTADSGDINLLANNLFREWRVGSQSQSKKGLLLVVNTTENKVRLEVGYELEHIYQDAFVSYIEHKQMVPYFNQNEVAKGMVATIELMVTRAQHAKLGKTETYQPWLEGSGGAGAVTNANINVPAAEQKRSFPEDILAKLNNLNGEESPQDIVDLYLQLAANRIHDWTLPLYTSASNKILADYKATAAQMDNTVRIFTACGQPEVRIDPSEHFAVVRYKSHQRLCSPFLLMKEKGVWRLDIVALGHGLRNNFSNEWYFDGTLKDNPLVVPYLFAFDDWYTTKKGYFYMYRWQVTVAEKRGCFKDFSVVRVVEKMPADQLGLLVGDVPLRVNGERVTDSCRFLSLIKQPKAGDKVELIVNRGGRETRLTGTAPPYVGGMNGKKLPDFDEAVAVWMAAIKTEFERN